MRAQARVHIIKISISCGAHAGFPPKRHTTFFAFFHCLFHFLGCFFKKKSAAAERDMALRSSKVRHISARLPCVDATWARSALHAS